MDRTTISKEDEAQFLGITFQEWLDDDRSKLAPLLEQFNADVEYHGIVKALSRITDRLSPEEAMLLALTALSNAAYGAKRGVGVIRAAHKVDLAEYVAAILWTSPLPDKTWEAPLTSPLPDETPGECPF